MVQHKVEISETVGVSASMSMTHAKKPVIRRHPVIFPLVLLIAIGSPFLGFFLTGWLGVAVGFVISIAAFIIGLRAVERERHFHHYDS